MHELMESLKEGGSSERSKRANREDATALGSKQEATFNNIVSKRCKQEAEGKARCCFADCNKLFKDANFLKKHLKAKHELFASEELLKDAEPYMKARYDAQDLIARPLPAISLELLGTIEHRSVGEILDRVTKKNKVGGGGGGGGGGKRGGIFDRLGGAVDTRDRPSRSNRHDDRRASDGGGGGEGGGRGGRGGRDSGGGGGRGRNEREYAPPRAEDNFQRTISSSYMDVDAPKESAVSLDYGVAVLPPAKKRKVVKK